MKPLLLFLLTLIPSISICAESSHQPKHAVYVWHRIWDERLVTALNKLDSTFEEIHYLAAQYDHEGWHPVTSKTEKIQRNTNQFIPVFRIDGLRPPKADDLLTAIEPVVQKYGYPEIEIDYDCPTNGLKNYIQLISIIKKKLPQIRIIITAIPDWMKNPALKDLLLATDSSILQVHGTLPIGKPIFDPKLSSEWIHSYSAITPRPFRVALPTYSFRYEKTFGVTTIESERPLGMDINSRMMIVEPGAIQSWLKHQPLKSKMKGYIWFRIPLDGDVSAWSLSTWLAVVHGVYKFQEPSLTYIPTSMDTWDLVIKNESLVDIPMPKTLPINPNCEIGDYTDSYHPLRIKAENILVRSQDRLLKPSSTLPVGWVRCTGKPYEK